MLDLRGPGLAVRTIASWPHEHGARPDRAATTGSQEAIPLDIIVVCRANMGRSPLLAVALQAQADRRLGPATIHVESAGIDAPSGAAAAAESRLVAEEWGLSLEDHRTRSTRFVPLDEALLVLAMTRRQGSILIRERPGLRERIFTVREAVTAFGDVAELGDVKGASEPRTRLASAVAAADLRRPPTRLRRRYDVPDPAGGDQAVYTALGEELGDAAQRLAEALFGPGPT